MRAARAVVSGLIGLVLALALGFGGLTRPEVVVGAVDAGNWNPTAWIFMLGASSLYGFAYRVTQVLHRPVFGSSYCLPRSRAVDLKLVVGSALFGVGWAMAGACPGPALTSLGAGTSWALTLVVPMFGGLWLGGASRPERLFAAVRRALLSPTARPNG